MGSYGRDNDLNDAATNGEAMADHLTMEVPPHDTCQPTHNSQTG